MLQLVLPPPPPPAPEDPDFYLSPTTKKKKSKKKCKNKGKKDNDLVDVDDSAHSTPGVSTPGTVGSAKDSKKKKRAKKLRYDSAALGVVIIPDCDVVYDDYEKEEKIGSSHYSSYTEQTSLLDDDDFTEATDEKKLEKPKTCPKSPKREKKKERRKSRRSSVKAQPKKDGDGNEKWGADPNGDKTFMAPELLNLLMDPAMQVGDSDSEKPRSRSGGLKKSNSFNGRKKAPRVSSARRSSVGCSLNMAGIETTKTRRHSKSRRKKESPGTGSKNATWGAADPATSSYSTELLNLYSAKKKEPSPMMRRNVKSFGGVNEKWRSSPSRENDIPSILFLSPENSINTNESWGLNSKLSSGPSSYVRRKGTISGMAAYDSMEDDDDEVKEITREIPPLPYQRRKSTDSRNSRGSSGSKGIGKSVSMMMMQNRESARGGIKRNESWGGDRGPVSKPPMPLPRKGSIGNGNESWAASPGARRSPLSPSTSPKLSPQLMGMLMGDTSPGASRTKAQKKKSPGAMKKSKSLGGIRNSPSMNGIKNSFANFKKMRGIKENAKMPLGIPNLA